MGRNLKPRCKQCRRIGESVCGSAKCALTKRSFAPGQHGEKRRTRLTQYGLQLREKQKAKLLYGIMERQFYNYYKQASKKVGNTSTDLMQLLESRLDNVVYRSGFASTRRQARQLVNHGHFQVNEKNCDIPSRQVKVGDRITVKASSLKRKFFQNKDSTVTMRDVPQWLQADKDKFFIGIAAKPTPQDFEQSVAINLVVEYYSR